MAYQYKEVGQKDTLEYKGYFYKDGHAVSPFHDIPLWADKSKNVANMVVEIPKGQQAKLEISKFDNLNPIKQDVKNGKLRYVAIKYPFNYGALPQTWENPETVHPDTKAKGDNDPVDAVDISSATYNTGDVISVKILGTYAMIDEGETDWKVVCINVNDPNADKINDASDIEKVFPGKLKEVFEFLRDYKIPDGKPANQFAFNGELKDKAFALQITHETHEDWHKLVTGKTQSKIATANVTNNDSPSKVSAQDADNMVAKP
eukprot:TRINITY_DN17957_c0_g1_i1.p1 TRINITY_DN17957_c0_g1~~TRINITY_DN17957_c0_g1_i1.p1  ORF type:complete len:270 (+),score=122.57 TRINITY_DN17957_c0_g1_i1:30-812(+)